MLISIILAYRSNDPCEKLTPAIDPSLSTLEIFDITEAKF